MIPIYHILMLSTFFFVLGLTTLIFRRNFLFTLIGLEIMIIAISLSFITSSNYWKQADGNIMFILIISYAAAEVSIGLSLLIKLYNYHNTLNIDLINEMKE